MYGWMAAERKEREKPLPTSGILRNRHGRLLSATWTALQPINDGKGTSFAFTLSDLLLSHLVVCPLVWASASRNRAPTEDAAPILCTTAPCSTQIAARKDRFLRVSPI